MVGRGKADTGHKKPKRAARALHGGGSTVSAGAVAVSCAATGITGLGALPSASLRRALILSVVLLQLLGFQPTENVAPFRLLGVAAGALGLQYYSEAATQAAHVMSSSVYVRMVIFALFLVLVKTRQIGGRLLLLGLPDLAGVVFPTRAKL